MKITDSDIIDFLMGDASPDLEQRVRHAVQTDTKVAALHAEWSAILPVMEQEREVQKALQKRALDRVMQRVAAEKTNQQESIPSRLDWGRLRPSWKGVCGALAAAACLVLIAGYLALSLGPSGPDQVGSAPAQVVSAEATQDSPPKQYVAFEYAGAGVGTESQPFATIERAVAAVDMGGALKIKSGSSNEQLRIAKPMRLEAVGGSVRIGSS